ncbi:MAG: hypothetical protein JWO75_861 [Actinomycetia bacterium]|jgi:hypothetical protein|nr:hypothetical protein [Actinomycetes bacterium]
MQDTRSASRTADATKIDRSGRATGTPTSAWSTPGCWPGRAVWQRSLPGPWAGAAPITNGRARDMRARLTDTQQPMKMVAAEDAYRTQNGAGFRHHPDPGG